jgi:hypothetical protein
MNYRLVAYSGIMTAILGAMFGLALSYIGRPDLDRLPYESEFYRTLNRRYPLIGSGVGLAVGSGFALISQTKKQRDRSQNSQKSSDFWR